MANWFTSGLESAAKTAAKTAPVQQVKKAAQTTVKAYKKPAPVMPPSKPAPEIKLKMGGVEQDTKAEIDRNLPEAIKNAPSPEMAWYYKGLQSQAISRRNEQIQAPKMYAPEEARQKFSEYEASGGRKAYTEDDVISYLTEKKTQKKIEAGELKSGGLIGELIGKRQLEIDSLWEAKQEFQNMTAVQKQDVAFEVITQKLKNSREDQERAREEQYKNDLEEIFYERLGTKAFIPTYLGGVKVNSETVETLLEQSSPKEKEAIEKEVEKRQTARGIFRAADKVVTQDLVEISDFTEEKERKQLESKMIGKVGEVYGEGVVSGFTLGVFDKFIRANKKGKDASLKGYSPDIIYEANRDVIVATEAASGVVHLVGSFMGGYLPYSAVASKVQKVFGMVPGKIGGVLTKTPVLSTYIFRNFGEEVVEAGIRKATGQEYGFKDFMAGMAMGAGFEGVASIMKSLKRAEKAVIKAEGAQGRPLTEQEFEQTVSALPYDKNRSFGDVFGERRLAFYKGGKEGRPGIDFPAEPPKPQRIGEKIINSEAGNTVREEMANAMAPSRFPLEDGSWTGTKSTFPSWVPDDLRKRTLFDKVDEHFLNGTVPKSKRQLELYNIAKEQMEVRFKEREGADLLQSIKEAEAKADEGFEHMDKLEPGLKNLRKTTEKISFVQAKMEDVLKGQWSKDKFAKVEKLNTKLQELGVKLQKEQALAEFQSLSKQKTTVKDLKLGEGQKAERLRSLEQEVAKRKAMELAVEQGTYAPAQKRAETEVRKSGGIVQDVLGAVGYFPGKGTSFVAGKIGKLAKALVPQKIQRGVNSVFKQFENLTKDATDNLEIYLRHQGREKTDMSEMVESLKSVIDKKVAAKPETSELLHRFLITGDDAGLSKELIKVATPVRNEIAIEGLRQVEMGNLDLATYYKNMDTYLRRVYGAREVEGFEFMAEKYNMLMNQLRESGWKTKDAENFIADLQIGAVNSKDLNALSQKTGKGGDFEGGGVTAGTKGVTGGFLKERVLGDDDLSLAIRDFLGEIKDPLYLVQKTLWQLKSSRMNYRLYKGFEGAGIIKPNLRAAEAADWQKIEGNTYGKEFNGQYIRKDVFDYLQKFNKPLIGKDATQWQRLGAQLNSQFKANVTSRNMPGQFRNFSSNLSTSRTVLRYNYASPSGIKELIDAGKELFSKGEFYQELKAYGRIEGGISKEIYTEMADGFSKITGDEKSIAKQMLNVIKKIDKKLGDVYQFNDMIFLVANYKKERARGALPIEALKEANRVTPNYDEISPFMKDLRSKMFGLPFVTWRAKVYPEVIKAIIKNPISGTQELWMPFAFAAGTMSTMNLTKEEREMVTTQLFRDGKVPLFRDEKGNIVSFDYMNYTPFADLFKGGYRGNELLTGWAPDPLYGVAKGSIPGLGSLPVSLLINLQSNYDPFLQRAISTAEYGSSEYMQDIALYLSGPLLPLLGGSVKNVSKAIDGKISWEAALVKSLTGARLDRSSVGGFEKQEKYKDKDFSLDKGEEEIRKEVRAIMEIRKANPEEAKKRGMALEGKYPDKIDFIDKRIAAEKQGEKTKTQDVIRQEAKSIVNLGKIDRQKAKKRQQEIEAEYPDFIDYLNKKLDEEMAEAGML